jgi:hypothetical protein
MTVGGALVLAATTVVLLTAGLLGGQVPILALRFSARPSHHHVTCMPIAPDAAGHYPSRSMPSALIREASVVGRTPSSSAAPPAPDTRPPHAAIAAAMFVRSSFAQFGLGQDAVARLFLNLSRLRTA